LAHDVKKPKPAWANRVADWFPISFMGTFSDWADLMHVEDKNNDWGQLSAVSSELRDWNGCHD